MSGSFRARGWWPAAGAVVVAAAAIGGVAFAATRGGSAPAHRILVTDTACAPHWAAPRSGRTVFTVENTSKVTTYNIDLASSNHVSVYGQIEGLDPGTSDTMDVVLPPGAYTFECGAFGGGTLDSDIARVSGPRVAAARSFQPVTPAQMRQVTFTYRLSLQPWLRKLAQDTDALTAAVKAGRLTAARSLWLTAHLDYSRLGAAYDTFGPYNDLIDGRPLGLPGGVRDPGFHGFLRLESGLWHGQPQTELASVAVALDRSVHGLVHAFPRLTMPDGDVPLRTHEILENTLQFELTGETDEGSHTNLATAWANVQGTNLALAAVSEILGSSSPGLVQRVQTGLTHLGEELKAYERPDGAWVPLQSLPRAQRERLDAATSGLLEQLELVPDRLEIQATLSTNGRETDD
ncbi:MAG TPA: EfeM/EfeO family lipoprotein [Gaiellaceae bacterium]|nr:EfeM/EfeO family lipoprotein [Gaiellaceae bacterium]